MSGRARLTRLLLGLAGVAALGAGPAAVAGHAAGPDAVPAAVAAPAAPDGHGAQHGRPAPGRPTAAQLARLRADTARYHNIATATDAGYGLLHDTAGLTCIAMPGEGGMGVHYVNGSLVGDPAIDPTRPEALVYAPDRDGTLRLAALEFIVDRAAWDAHHAHRPRLFRGAPFDLIDAPNRFGLAPFYAQHVWVWKANPAGVLNMWNPRVVCPA